MSRNQPIAHALVALFALTAVAHAQDGAVPAHGAQGAAPIQLALFEPVQIVKPDRSVSGLRLDLIYGRNVDVTGVDWGLVNHDTGSGFAWQAGVVNMVQNNFTGWQDGGVNVTGGTFTGLQSGVFNQSEAMNGFAYGIVNRTRSMHGVQLGVVNITETMHGLQIGVANMIQKGRYPFLPIVNWSF